MTATMTEDTLARQARIMRAQFAGYNARTPTGTAVHAVDMAPWRGYTAPAATCRVAVSGDDALTLQPTAQTVTCRRCLRLRPDLAMVDTADQPPLFDL